MTLTPGYLNCSIELAWLRCVSTVDSTYFGSTGDEPYMMNFFFMVDGSNTKFVKDAHGKFRLQSNPSVFVSPGGVGNLGIAQDGATKGSLFRIPWEVGQCWFHPFRRLVLPSPCDALYKVPGAPGFGVIGVVSVVMEHESLGAHEVEVGKMAAAAKIRESIKIVVEELDIADPKVPDEDELVKRFGGPIETALVDGIMSDLSGWEMVNAKFDRDLKIGVFAKTWEYEELHLRRLWQLFGVSMQDGKTFTHKSTVGLGPGVYELEGWVSSMPQVLVDHYAAKGEPALLGLWTP